MNTLQAEYTNEIATLNARIAHCNEAICSKATAEWAVKELRQVKKEYMNRKIQLIKILSNPLIWN